MHTEQQKEVIENTIKFVQKTLADAEGGHDWFHIERVWKNTKLIGETEQIDMFIAELGSLLHDIADSKFHDGDEEIGPKTARIFLLTQDVDDRTITHVENIIRYISFKGSIEGQKWTSPELDVVQDADRLDALGAIGIARTFNYGGFKGRCLYNPAIKPNLSMSKDEYKASTAPTLNHFYEKLLLLKDKINTKTGRKLAQQRHDFLELYLEQFLAEWDGEK